MREDVPHVALVRSVECWLVTRTHNTDYGHKVLADPKRGAQAVMDVGLAAKIVPFVPHQGRLVDEIMADRDMWQSLALETLAEPDVGIVIVNRMRTTGIRVNITRSRWKRHHSGNIDA